MDSRRISNFKFPISNILINSLRVAPVEGIPDSAQSRFVIRPKQQKKLGRALTGRKLATGPAKVNWKFRNGLSLIELLIAFAIIGMVSILVAAVYFAHSRLFSTQNTSIDVASQNKLAIDEITNQIRESQAVVATCALCSPDSTSDTIVILQIWPINSAGEPFDPVAVGSDYDFIIYKQDSTDNTKLVKKIIPGTGSFRQAIEKIIAINISDLQFSYDNANPTLTSEVSASLTTSANSGGKTITSSQTTKAVLRNK